MAFSISSSSAHRAANSSRPSSTLAGAGEVKERLERRRSDILRQQQSLQRHSEGLAQEAQAQPLLRLIHLMAACHQKLADVL